MSYTDAIIAFSFAHTDCHDMAQGWLADLWDAAEVIDPFYGWRAA